MSSEPVGLSSASSSEVSEWPQRPSAAMCRAPPRTAARVQVAPMLGPSARRSSHASATPAPPSPIPPHISISLGAAAATACCRRAAGVTSAAHSSSERDDDCVDGATSSPPNTKSVERKRLDEWPKAAAGASADCERSGVQRPGQTELRFAIT
eukprot:1679905-Prymnesium_polylepis.1